MKNNPTEKEALAIIDKLVVVIQKARSNEKEAADRLSEDGEASDRVLEQIQPWLFGPKSILPGLLKVQERGSIEPQEFYNFMYICQRLAPELAIIYSVFAEEALLDPTIDLMRGWRNA